MNDRISPQEEDSDIVLLCLSRESECLTTMMPEKQLKRHHWRHNIPEENSGKLEQDNSEYYG